VYYRAYRTWLDRCSTSDNQVAEKGSGFEKAMKWAILLLLAFGVIARFSGEIFGEAHQMAAWWGFGLYVVLLCIGQMVNWAASKFGPEAAVLGDATRIALRMFLLVLVGLTLEISGRFPSQSLVLWGWLLAGTLLSLVIEIAILTRVAK
jgi:hypothetical protein